MSDSTMPLSEYLAKGIEVWNVRRGKTVVTTVEIPEGADPVSVAGMRVDVEGCTPVLLRRQPADKYKPRRLAARPPTRPGKETAFGVTYDPYEAPAGYFAVPKAAAAGDSNICAYCEWRRQCNDDSVRKDVPEHRCMAVGVILPNGRTVTRADGASVLFRKLPHEV